MELSMRIGMDLLTSLGASAGVDYPSPSKVPSSTGRGHVHATQAEEGPESAPA